MKRVFLVCLASKVGLVHKDLLVKKEQQVFLDFLEGMAKKVMQVYLDFLVLEVTLDHKGPQECLDEMEPKVTKEMKVKEASKVPRDFKESQVLLVLQDCKVNLVNLGEMD